MARYFPLLAALGWLSVSAAQDYHQQTLIGGSVAAEPVPMAAETVREKLKAAEVIPTVIDDFSPSLGLHVSWLPKHRARLGNTLEPEDLKDEPSIALHDIQAASGASGLSASNTTYVVALTDPDAPTRDNPKWSEYCHWIASGTLKPALCDPMDPGPCPPVLTDPSEVVPYQPPTPPEKTGPHRYVFLAFVPSNGTTDKLHLAKPPARKHWGYAAEGGKTPGVREWAKENGLAPVGANFIYAKNNTQ